MTYKTDNDVKVPCGAGSQPVMSSVSPQKMPIRKYKSLFSVLKSICDIDIGIVLLYHNENYRGGIVTDFLVFFAPTPLPPQ